MRRPLGLRNSDREVPTSRVVVEGALDDLDVGRLGNRRPDHLVDSLRGARELDRRRDRETVVLVVTETVEKDAAVDGHGCHIDGDVAVFFLHWQRQLRIERVRLNQLACVRTSFDFVRGLWNPHGVEATALNRRILCPVGYPILEIDGTKIDIDQTDAGLIMEHDRLRGQELRGRLELALVQPGETVVVLDPNPDERQRLFDAVAALAANDRAVYPLQLGKALDALRAGGTRSSM